MRVSCGVRVCALGGVAGRFVGGGNTTWRGALWRGAVGRVLTGADAGAAVDPKRVVDQKERRDQAEENRIHLLLRAAGTHEDACLRSS